MMIVLIAVCADQNYINDNDYCNDNDDDCDKKQNNNCEKITTLMIIVWDIHNNKDLNTYSNWESRKRFLSGYVL